MPDVAFSARNKIELESQVLCAALRQSWAGKDPHGTATSARELYQLFPDLLPAPKLHGGLQPVNYYEILCIRPQVSASQAQSAFLRLVRCFLRTVKVKDKREEYYQILDAGFILRKPRLRLSHDLVVVRSWLIQTKTIPEDGTLEVIELKETKTEAQMTKTQPIVAELPRLVQLLKEAQFIGPSEVQALVAQMALAPEVSVERLALDSGYVSQQEMNSLKLAEMLLEQGKITLAQFQVAIYDERTSGTRMAESLQLRGWLPVEVKGQTDESK
ncbi:MAG: hypothetical protein HY711_06205 [Candidatus Melainabacteria bacterium]|nr:hypothetical protein [Candidatus Melainabacteria bacterium]